MPGTARSSSFLLSTATVMIGPMADLHKLNPAAHSVGLVKNFQLTADPQFVELGQGIKNTIVMSVKTNDGVKASFEVYEYSAKNLAYGAGLDGTDVEFAANTDLWLSTASITAAAAAIDVDGDISADLAADDYIFIQAGTDDIVHIAKVVSAVFNTPDTTITFTGYDIPTGVTFPIGSRVGKVSRLDIGGSSVHPEFAAKVVGLLPKNNEPFTILIPRVKITKGLGVAFQSDNFGNLPFEFTPYAGLPTDPFYADYGEAAAILFPR